MCYCSKTNSFSTALTLRDCFKERALYCPSKFTENTSTYLALLRIINPTIASPMKIDDSKTIPNDMPFTIMLKVNRILKKIEPRYEWKD